MVLVSVLSVSWVGVGTVTVWVVVTSVLSAVVSFGLLSMVRWLTGGTCDVWVSVMWLGERGVIGGRSLVRLVRVWARLVTNCRQGVSCEFLVKRVKWLVWVVNSCVGWGRTVNGGAEMLLTTLGSVGTLRATATSCWREGLSRWTDSSVLS